MADFSPGMRLTDLIADTALEFCLAATCARLVKSLLYASQQRLPLAS